MAAVDGHRGRALDDTAQGVVGIQRAIAIGVVLVRTAAAAIDVAAIGIFGASLTFGVGSHRRRSAYRAAV